MILDCIVVGLGGIGSSALFHLARQGLNVLGLEQFAPVHDLGSSHGETRIIRKAYFEHPDYVPLLHEAYHLWEELEHLSGEELLVRSGLVLSGPAEGEAISGALRSAREHQLQIEALDPQQASQRFPRYRFPPGHTVVYEAEAGYLRVEESVRQALQQARHHGALLHFEEPLRSWSSLGDTVSLKTDKGDYVARQVIFAGGAWSAELLKGCLPHLQVLRKVQVWYPLIPSDSAEKTPEPAFYLERPEGAFYGIPTPLTATIKIAEHTLTQHVVDPATVDRQIREEDLRPLDELNRTFLSGTSPVHSKHAVCMYTMSPDGHFILDWHPQFSNVQIAAGFSGHGFKFASVLGKALAERAATGHTLLPIDFLSLRRFS